MIFVATGSRKFQFNRLIKKLDELVAEGIIKDNVFAQIAETSYLPKNYDYKKYLTPAEFAEYQDRATLVITHAGTGALIGALKKGKQVIAVPRLFKYGEHSDDHQLQIADVLKKEGYLRTVIDINDLGNVILACYNNPIKKVYNKPSNVINVIETQLEKWF